LAFLIFLPCPKAKIKEESGIQSKEIYAIIIPTLMSSFHVISAVSLSVVLNNVSVIGHVPVGKKDANVTVISVGALLSNKNRKSSLK